MNTRTIISTPFPQFNNRTKWPQQLIKNFLVRGMRHVLIGTYGAAKSTVSLDIVGSILTQREWLGRFAINASNPVIFYVSEDASDTDLKAQSYKVLREYFSWTNPEHARLLNARFHVVAGQNIKLPADQDAVIEMIRNTIRGWDEQGRLQPFGEPVREVSFEDMAPHEVANASRAVERKEVVEAETPIEAGEIDLSRFDILLIYDSARRIHNAKESDSKEMSEVNNALSAIERATGATSLVLLHENRRGEYKGDTSIIDSAQQAYQLTCERSKRHDPVRDITVGVEKNRGLNVQPFIIKFAWTGQETADEKIRLSHGGDAPRDGDRKERPSRAGRVLPDIDPILTAVRKQWTPGMSARALHETLTKKLKLNVSRDRVGKLVKTVQVERSMDDAIKETA
jgi:hypothetical protein